MVYLVIGIIVSAFLLFAYEIGILSTAVLWGSVIAAGCLIGYGSKKADEKNKELSDKFFQCGFAVFVALFIGGLFFLAKAHF